MVFDRVRKVLQTVICIPESAVDRRSKARLRCPHGGCYLSGLPLQHRHAPPVLSIGKLMQSPQHAHLVDRRHCRRASSSGSTLDLVPGLPRLDLEEAGWAAGPGPC
jgi:hypothetical protein